VSDPQLIAFNEPLARILGTTPGEKGEAGRGADPIRAVATGGPDWGRYCVNMWSERRCNALGIPTTRALATVATGEQVVRETRRNQVLACPFDDPTDAADLMRAPLAKEAVQAMCLRHLSLWWP
jgi:hypothetical protein